MASSKKTTEKPQEEAVKTVSIKFTEQELGIVSEALVYMPFKLVAGLLNNIQNQVNAQIAPPA